MSCYDNMTGGLTLYQTGRALGTVFPEDTVALLRAAGIKPCGGTLKNPRYPQKHVEELAAIRKSKGQQK